MNIIDNLNLVFSFIFSFFLIVTCLDYYLWQWEKKKVVIQMNKKSAFCVIWTFIIFNLVKPWNNFWQKNN